MNSSHTEFGALSAEILSQGRQLRFQAHGRSMRPFIRAGDVLTVAPVSVAALRVGDILFCSLDSNKLVVHRLTRRREQVGQLKLIIQGDALVNVQEIVSSDQVLGRVTSRQRNSKIIRLDRGAWKWLGVVWVKLLLFRPCLLWWGRKFRQLLVN